MVKLEHDPTSPAIDLQMLNTFPGGKFTLAQISEGLRENCQPPSLGIRESAEQLILELDLHLCGPDDRVVYTVDFESLVENFIKEHTEFNEGKVHKNFVRFVMGIAEVLRGLADKLDALELDT